MMELLFRQKKSQLYSGERFSAVDAGNLTIYAVILRNDFCAIRFFYANIVWVNTLLADTWQYRELKID